jgi:voltage-gated potassium channel
LAEEARHIGRHAWDALVLGVAVGLAFVVPLRVVVQPGAQPVSLLADIALTALFAADVGMRLRRQRARTAPWIAIDVVAALPLGALLGPAWSLLRLLKLARLFPLLGGFQRTVTLHPTVPRLVAFGFVLVFSVHWLACGWLGLGGPSGATGTRPYLGALYWTITTLTTVGYGDVTPTTSSQTVYAMTVMLLGVGLYGFVIGNMATLLTRMDMAKAQYLGTLERLTGFLRYRRIPPELQRHIYDYYKYLWENRMGYDEASVLSTLPPTLRQELSLVLKSDLIEKVPFLHGASRELVRDLCRELLPVVFTPGDVVMRAGDYGRHVYFISSGVMEVLDESGELIRTLGEGDLFGEIALLYDQPRSATVRSLGYSDLYMLDRDAFKRTLVRYPDFAEHVARLSAERLD